MQNHAADQLHIEMPHVQNAAASFADHGEGFDQKLIQDLVDQLSSLIVEFFQTVLVRVGLVRNTGQAFLYPLAKFVRLSAQLLIAELPLWRAQAH